MLASLMWILSVVADMQWDNTTKHVFSLMGACFWMVANVFSLFMRKFELEGIRPVAVAESVAFRFP